VRTLSPQPAVNRRTRRSSVSPNDSLTGRRQVYGQRLGTSQFLLPRDPTSDPPSRFPTPQRSPQPQQPGGENRNRRSISHRSALFFESDAQSEQSLLRTRTVSFEDIRRNVPYADAAINNRVSTPVLNAAAQAGQYAGIISPHPETFSTDDEADDEAEDTRTTSQRARDRQQRARQESDAAWDETASRLTNLPRPNPSRDPVAAYVHDEIRRESEPGGYDDLASVPSSLPPPSSNRASHIEQYEEGHIGRYHPTVYVSPAQRRRQQRDAQDRHSAEHLARMSDVQIGQLFARYQREGDKMARYYLDWYFNGADYEVGRDREAARRSYREGFAMVEAARARRGLAVLSSVNIVPAHGNEQTHDSSDAESVQTAIHDDQVFEEGLRLRDTWEAEHQRIHDLMQGKDIQVRDFALENPPPPVAEQFRFTSWQKYSKKEEDGTDSPSPSDKRPAKPVPQLSIPDPSSRRRHSHRTSQPASLSDLVSPRSLAPPANISNPLVPLTPVHPVETHATAAGSSSRDHTTQAFQQRSTSVLGELHEVARRNAGDSSPPTHTSSPPIAQTQPIGA
jgi:hypothetical protein